MPIVQLVPIQKGSSFCRVLGKFRYNCFTDDRAAKLSAAYMTVLTANE